jgi:hypothetical protein
MKEEFGSALEASKSSCVLKAQMRAQLDSAGLEKSFLSTRRPSGK